MPGWNDGLGCNNQANVWFGQRQDSLTLGFSQESKVNQNLDSRLGEAVEMEGKRCKVGEAGCLACRKLSQIGIKNFPHIPFSGSYPSLHDDFQLYP